MDKKLVRACLMEFLGTLGLVYFAAGVVCVNHLTTPAGQEPGSYSQTAQQPGLVGIALAYGLVSAGFLAITLPRSGGYLNPAVALMLWVFGRLETRKMLLFIAAQMLGSLVGGLLVRITFHSDILHAVHFATPHLNLQAYPQLAQITLTTGSGIELVLTFFLVLAIFGTAKDGSRADSLLPALAAGAVTTVSVLFAYALTGAALNPARWFGPCCWEAQDRTAALSPWSDMVVYVAGPILGSLLAGLFWFKVFESEKL